MLTRIERRKRCRLSNESLAHWVTHRHWPISPPGRAPPPRRPPPPLDPTVVFHARVVVLHGRTTAFGGRLDQAYPPISAHDRAFLPALHALLAAIFLTAGTIHTPVLARSLCLSLIMSIDFIVTTPVSRSASWEISALGHRPLERDGDGQRRRNHNWTPHLSSVSARRHCAEALRAI